MSGEDAGVRAAPLAPHSGSIIIGLYRKTARKGVPALILCLLGLPLSGAAGSDSTPIDQCPDLSHYASQSYASPQGIRRRCGLLADIKHGGEPLPPALRGRVLAELSHRFAVDIRFTGTLDIPRRAVDYLLGHMPEAAALTSNYSRKQYAATQSDEPQAPAQFFITDNHSFAAELTYLLADKSPGLSRYIFFESGEAKVLFWTVWGNSFIRYDLRQEGESASRYDIRVQVFTNSRLLRAVLGSGLFHHFAFSMFKDVVKDVETAVHRFSADPNPPGILPSYFVRGLRVALRAAPEPRGVPWSGAPAR